MARWRFKDGCAPWHAHQSRRELFSDMTTKNTNQSSFAYIALINTSKDLVTFADFRDNFEALPDTQELSHLSKLTSTNASILSV